MDGGEDELPSKRIVYVGVEYLIDQDPGACWSVGTGGWAEDVGRFGSRLIWMVVLPLLPYCHEIRHTSHKAVDEIRMD